MKNLESYGVILAILILAVAVFVNASQKQMISVGGPFQKDTITVSGSAMRSLQPDEVNIFIRIQTFEKTANEAQNKNRDLTNSVIAALKRDGVKDSDIQTESFNLGVRQKYDPDTGKYSIEGYEANHVLKIISNNINSAGKLIDNSVQAGANGVDSIVFKLSKEREAAVKTEMLKDAVKNAREKAQALAESAGIRLGKVVSISESGFFIPIFEKSVSAIAQTPITIQPREVEAQVSVTVAFEIA